MKVLIDIAGFVEEITLKRLSQAIRQANKDGLQLVLSGCVQNRETDCSIPLFDYLHGNCLNVLEPKKEEENAEGVN